MCKDTKIMHNKQQIDYIFYKKRGLSNDNPLSYYI